MNVIYACYGKAGLDGLYKLITQKEIQPNNILAITYLDKGNVELIKHLKALNIRYLTESINNSRVINQILKFKPDYLFSIYYRDIIGKKVLKLIRKTAVNLHPSLLPDYKGCFSAPWVLVNGETRTGITYHIINEGIDTGDILIQRQLEITPWDTAFSLYHKLISVGIEYFSQMFQLVARDNFRGIPQEDMGRTFKRSIPYEGYFSLKWSKERIHNFIRAMYFPPYEGAKLKYKGKVYEFKSPDDFGLFAIKYGIKFK